MATFKICVFDHQQRDDGRFPISIRITNNRKSVYLNTGMYATRSQIPKDFSTVKDRVIVRAIDRKIQEYEDVIVQKLEKPRDFDPFGQAGLSPLATI